MQAMPMHRLSGLHYPGASAPQTFFLGHAKYFGGPVMSRIAKMIQVIPVDMEARLAGALQLSAHVLRSGRILCVFPEGTRSHDGKMKEFKKGVGIIAKGAEGADHSNGDPRDL